jgi:hypothetical protein
MSSPGAIGDWQLPAPNPEALAIRSIEGLAGMNGSLLKFIEPLTAAAFTPCLDFIGPIAPACRCAD